jgi:tRNA 5-methylaminomethyl-2-thiouridine biosynthesis bifunctional protein
MNITFRGGIEVARMEHDGGCWHMFGAHGEHLAESSVVVLASGALAGRLEQVATLPISRVRGQVSHIPAGKLPRLAHAVCCEGYLTPALAGVHCLGASYAYDEGEELRLAEHEGNLHRLARILPGADQSLNPAELSGRVGFRAATPDRLPLVGALPDPGLPLAKDCRLADLPRQPGLYGLLGLGSRGLVWTALAAETLASQLEGDPMPLASDLLDAIDAGRFRLRAHRRGKG